MYKEKLEFSFEITQRIISLVGKIDLFKGKWKTIIPKENLNLKQLRKIATIESIGSSTRIEGVTLVDAEIEKLLSNVNITKFETRNEQEVFGYHDALNIILEEYSDIELTENYISQFHSILLKVSSKDQRHRGQYKTLSNKVVATYPDGKQKIIFNTTEPHLVKKEMSELVEWTAKELRGNNIHPLIIIATFVYEFLSIHPFQDGNGRLSRLLTTLLLLKNDYSFIQYISLEHIIEERKKDYYQALMSGQKNRYSEEEKIDEWILFFLSSLEILIAKLEIKLQSIENKRSYLNERQKKILDLLKEFQPMKVGDLNLKLEGYSINTIKKDLQYLVQESIVEKIGNGRGTIYLLKNE